MISNIWCQFLYYLSLIRDFCRLLDVRFQSSFQFYGFEYYCLLIFKRKWANWIFLPFPSYRQENRDSLDVCVRRGGAMTSGSWKKKSMSRIRIPAACETNTLGKGMNLSLLSPNYGLNSRGRMCIVALISNQSSKRTILNWKLCKALSIRML